MATMPSLEQREQFSKYDRLAAEYQACAAQCRASLDQLQAAERELLAASSELGHENAASELCKIGISIRRSALRSRALNLHAVQHLSQRERNVFELIGQGLPTGAIGQCLNIATSTVE